MCGRLGQHHTEAEYAMPMGWADCDGGSQSSPRYNAPPWHTATAVPNGRGPTRGPGSVLGISTQLGSRKNSTGVERSNG